MCSGTSMSWFGTHLTLSAGMVASLFGLAKALKTRIMQLRMLIKGTLSTQVGNQGRVRRFRNKENVIASTDIDSQLQGEAAIAARRAAAINSSASAHSALWRAKCKRVGSRWVPMESQEVPRE